MVLLQHMRPPTRIINKVFGIQGFASPEVHDMRGYRFTVTGACR